ncbi:MAG: hypothetical protein H0W34_08165 [Pyrinomonadaceae bacterium]|jgi:hypothetical protein|nr:hypothetical protein [Pyrinomonadaceae bacterium]
MFNEGRFWERTQAGELRAVVAKERIPSEVDDVTIPLGSVSQEVRYYDQDNNEVARIHWYIKPDGSIGGSGLPDPKRLMVNGILYRLEKKTAQPDADPTTTD